MDAFLIQKLDRKGWQLDGDLEWREQDAIQEAKRLLQKREVLGVRVLIAPVQDRPIFEEVDERIENMAWNLAVATRNVTGDALVDQLDTGGTATIEIRTGTQPANADDAATGTLLATLTFSATAWGTFSSGTAAAAAITSDTNIDATGTAGYARMLNGDASTHSDMDIGQGSGTLSFDDTDFVAGGTASISSMSITMPAS